jgi:hypothetical protein
VLGEGEDVAVPLGEVEGVALGDDSVGVGVAEALGDADSVGVPVGEAPAVAVSVGVSVAVVLVVLPEGEGSALSTVYAAGAGPDVAALPGSTSSRRRPFGRAADLLSPVVTRSCTPSEGPTQ